MIEEGWSNEFIGIEYSRYDCWQLAVEVYRRVLDIELPDYSGTYAKPIEVAESSAMILEEARDWVQIDIAREGSKHPSLRKAEPFDLLLFRIGQNLPLHIGVSVERGSMLTTQRSRGSGVQKTGSWERRLMGIYRHKSITESGTWNKGSETTGFMP